MTAKKTSAKSVTSAKPPRGAAKCPAVPEIPRPEAEFRVVPLAALHPSDYNPRREFSPDMMAVLKESIERVGVLQPIVVREFAETDDAAESWYEIVAGERRWRAAEAAGLLEVPVMVRDLDDHEALELALMENLQREELSPVEEAQGYHDLMARLEWDAVQVMERLGVGRSTLYARLALLNLPPDILERLAGGSISLAAAEEIGRLHAAPEEQMEVLAWITEAPVAPASREVEREVTERLAVLRRAEVIEEEWRRLAADKEEIEALWPGLGYPDREPTPELLPIGAEVPPGYRRGYAALPMAPVAGMRPVVRVEGIADGGKWRAAGVVYVDGVLAEEHVHKLRMPQDAGEDDCAVAETPTAVGGAWMGQSPEAAEQRRRTEELAARVVAAAERGNPPHEQVMWAWILERLVDLADQHLCWSPKAMAARGVKPDEAEGGEPSMATFRKWLLVAAAGEMRGLYCELVMESQRWPDVGGLDAELVASAARVMGVED